MQEEHGSFGASLHTYADYAWLPDELNAEESVWDISHFWATQAQEKGLLGAMYLDQRMYVDVGEDVDKGQLYLII